MGNILKRADEIVNQRSEEKERQYGPFHEQMARATRIFNEMGAAKLTVPDMYKAMIAIKLSREAYSHKEDNLLDAVAYLGSLNNVLERIGELEGEQNENRKEIRTMLTDLAQNANTSLNTGPGKTCNENGIKATFKNEPENE